MQLVTGLSVFFIAGIGFFLLLLALSELAARLMAKKHKKRK